MFPYGALWGCGGHTRCYCISPQLGLVYRGESCGLTTCSIFLQNRRSWHIKESGEMRTSNGFWIQLRNPGKIAVVQIKNACKTRVIKLQK